MNAIINNNMTLDEKLAAIDAALLNAEIVAAADPATAPIDPASLVMCESCQ